MKNTRINWSNRHTPAWGREHYRGLKGIEAAMALHNAGILAKQYLLNKGNFRRYVHDQAFLSLPPLLLKAAQQLIPAITREDIEMSPKVAIRSQLFNQQTQKLEDDFLCLPGPHSTHILNAISPAFTASFALADLILERSGFLTHAMTQPIRALLLAAGFGTRLRPLTLTTPRVSGTDRGTAHCWERLQSLEACGC